MSTTKKSKPKAAKTPANIVWFEIPADDVDRAKKFYTKLFDWKINPIPGIECWHIDTGGADASPDGGIVKRQNPQHSPVNYVLVPSINKHVTKVKKLGGKICVPKMAVGDMGFFAVCLDTENNPFAIWEVNKKAKK